MFHFINRCLSVNRNSNNYIDGTTLMNLLIAIFENMQGLIDADFPILFKFIVDEIQFTLGLKSPPKKYILSILQAVSMAFLYNSQLAFSYLEQNNMTLTVFQTWFE